MNDGSDSEDFPYDLSEIKLPVYTDFKGWDTEVKHDGTYEDFPVELKEYIEFIEKYLGVSISVVSLGPDRTETLIREDLVSF